MKYLRYLILIMIFWGLPGYLNAYWSPTLGSLASYMTSGSLLLFFFLSKPKHRLPLPFIILGILYFTLSTINFSDEDSVDFIKDFFRYLIVAICLGEVLIRTSNKELVILLTLGALSIIINAVFFPDAYQEFSTVSGRASGFYRNPNGAGVIALIGFALSFTVHSIRWRSFLFLLFTLAGLLTLSRSFVVVWLFLNILGTIRSRKNSIGLVTGAVVIIVILSLSTVLELNTRRFEALQAIFTNEGSTRAIQEDTRMQTWAKYIDKVWDAPIVGNGYNKLRGKQYGGSGIHNSFLMAWGEAGIVPFLLMIGIYLHLLVKSWRYYAPHPELFYLTWVVILAMMVGHGYFENFITVGVSIYVYMKLYSLGLEAQEDLSTASGISALEKTSAVLQPNRNSYGKT